MKKLLVVLLFVSVNAFAATPSGVNFEVFLPTATQTGNAVNFQGTLIATPSVIGQIPFDLTFNANLDFGDGQSVHVGPTHGDAPFIGPFSRSITISAHHVYEPGSFTALMTFDAEGFWFGFTPGNQNQPQIPFTAPIAYHFERAFQFTVVPEPHTYALMLAGLALMGWRKQWLKK